MFRKYTDYKFACLNKKNFIISQALAILSNVALTLFLIIAVFFAVGFLYPHISTLFAR